MSAAKHTPGPWFVHDHSGAVVAGPFATRPDALRAVPHSARGDYMVACPDPARAAIAKAEGRS